LLDLLPGDVVPEEFRWSLGLLYAVVLVDVVAPLPLTLSTLQRA
jgi:hypothetical protein